MQSKKSYRSQSSYYMPGANAVAPEYYEADLYEEQSALTKEVKQQKKVKHIIAGNIKVLAAIFVLATLVVGQYVYIAGLGYNLVREENQLNAVLSSNEKLKQEYANLNDLSTIENYAVNNLGMIKADASMVYTASNDAADGSENEETAADNSGVLSNIISGVMGIFN